MVEGKGFGTNSMSALVTRGSAELRKIAMALGADSETLFGLSGIGDLMLTSFGGLSRNKSVGLRMAKGETVEEIINSMKEVAEGVPTIDVVINMNKELKLDIPIMEICYKLIHNEITPESAVEYLMSYKIENEF